MQACLPAGREAMTRFLASWYKLSDLYECRGTNELSDWYLVTLHELYKWALVQCCGTRYGLSQEFVKVQKFYLGAVAGIRVERYEGHVIRKQEVQKL